MSGFTWMRLIPDEADAIAENVGSKPTCKDSGFDFMNLHFGRKAFAHFKN
jgi:hypothetical protein